MNRSLAIVRGLRYALFRHNHEMMLMTVDTRTFLPEAAWAASASPCRHTSVETDTRNGFVPALAERWMR